MMNEIDRLAAEIFARKVGCTDQNYGDLEAVARYAYRAALAFDMAKVTRETAPLAEPTLPAPAVSGGDV